MSELRKRVGTSVLALVAPVAIGAVFSAAPAQAQATTATVNERLRFDNRSFIIPPGAPRAGETITLDGGLHVLLHLTVSSSGNCLVKGHANPQGLRVTLAGVTYRAVGAANLTAHSQKDGDMTRLHAVANLGLKSERGRGERVKVNFKGDVAPSCTAIHNLAVEAVELLRGEE